MVAATWWAKLASDTGYSIQYLRDSVYRSTDTTDTESKRLPRARHALSQLAPDELEELLQDLPEAKAKTERAEQNAPWWEKLAADTGYSVRHLQNASHPSVGDSAAESKRLPRARHALSQLARGSRLPHLDKSLVHRCTRDFVSEVRKPG